MSSMPSMQKDETKSSLSIYHVMLVVVSILLMATIFGTIVNAFSLFIKPVLADLKGITIAEFTYAYSVLTFIGIPIAPVVGNLLRRFDARYVISFGVLMAVLANVLLSQAQGIWWIYGAAVLQGIAITLATTIPISTMVTNWFKKGRGTALGLATAGSGLGSLIFVPLITFYLFPTFGWRNTYLVLAAIQAVLLIPLALLFLANTPEQKKQFALGAEPTAAVAQDGPAPVRPGLTQAQAYRSPAFWVLGAALIFAGISVNGMISNLVPLLGALKSPTEVVAFIMSTIGLFVMVGKFLTGIVFDKMNLMVAIAIISLANAAQFFFMLAPTTILSGGAFSFLHGFGATMVTVTPAYLAARLFGDREYSAVYGGVSMFAMAGAGIGPIVSGFFYGGKLTSTAEHATTLVWVWLALGLIGFALFWVTVKLKPHWEPEGYKASH